MAAEDGDWREALVRQIHRAGCQIVLAVTGGGSAAIGELLRVPGGSASLLEATVPYSAPALAALLGAMPEHACREATARAMAMAAFERARKYAAADFDRRRLVGVGCTASLVSDRPKRGAHRAHLAWQTHDTTASASVELVKGARDRDAEEDLAASFILWGIGTALRIDTKAIQLPLSPREQVATNRKTAPPAWQQLLLGAHDAILATDATSTCRPSVDRAIFPGAFHPRHQGHRQMALVAAEQLGRVVEHEISIENIDKPPLDYLEMEQQAAQFAADEPVWFTRAPRFIDKAKLFAGATFIVGIDTLARIIDPRYYGGELARRDAAIESIAGQGCRFLVFGRMIDRRFRGLADVQLPPGVKAICNEVPEQRFRADISSTELRRLVEDDADD